MPSFSIQALLPSDWAELIQPELASRRFERLEQQISLIYGEHAEEIAPAFENIFRAFEETSVNKTHVIILGQDPYQTPGLAQEAGLSAGDHLASINGERVTPGRLEELLLSLIQKLARVEAVKVLVYRHDK